MSFYKTFNKLCKVHDNTIVFRDWLDYSIDQFLINPDLKYFQHDKYNENEYKLFFELFETWIKNMETRIKEGYKWFDLIGYFYEETVKSSSKASNMGQFFTPPHVCDLMTKLTVKPLKNNGAGEKMYDCAGGSGRLCLSFHSQYPKALCFSHDLDEVSCKMAVLNFLIHGIKGSVCQYNSLTGEFYNGWKINEFPLSIMEINNIRESMIFIGEKTRNTIKLSCPKHSGQTSLGDYI